MMRKITTKPPWNQTRRFSLAATSEKAINKAKPNQTKQKRIQSSKQRKRKKRVKISKKLRTRQPTQTIGNQSRIGIGLQQKFYHLQIGIFSTGTMKWQTFVAGFLAID
jgi:hypothetical protein